MGSGEIEGDDTGVSAYGLFHPEPSWPARLALNLRSPHSTCWRPPAGVQGPLDGLGWAGAISPRCSGPDRPILSEVNHRLESRMREIRPSGLEGGGTDNRFSLSLSKAGSARKMSKHERRG